MSGENKPWVTIVTALISAAVGIFGTWGAFQLDLLKVDRSQLDLMKFSYEEIINTYEKMGDHENVKKKRLEYITMIEQWQRSTYLVQFIEQAAMEDSNSAEAKEVAEKYIAEYKRNPLIQADPRSAKALARSYYLMEDYDKSVAVIDQSIVENKGMTTPEELTLKNKALIKKLSTKSQSDDERQLLEQSITANEEIIGAIESNENDDENLRVYPAYVRPRINTAKIDELPTGTH
ncbi:MAG: hypothetical protein ACFHWX_18360 [Bacteroidota bacterium]